MSRRLWLSARLVGWVLSGSALLAVGVLLALRFDPFGTVAFRTGAGVALPAWADIQVGRVSGSWTGDLRLVAFRFEDKRSGTVVSADSIALSYNPVSWRRGRIFLNSVTADGVEILADLESSSRDESQDPLGRGVTSQEGGGWTLAADRITLRDTRGVLGDHGVDAFRWQAGNALFTGVQLGPESRLTTWQVESEFNPAGEPPGWGRLSGSGSFSDGGIRLDTLSLESSRSRVRGSGWVSLVAPLGEPGAIEWTLEAAPLNLADLRGLVRVPGVVEGDSVTLMTRARSSEDSASVVLEGSFPGGGEVKGEVRWGRGEASWLGRWTATVRGVDPRRYLGNAAPAGPMNGSLEGLASFGQEPDPTGFIGASASWRVESPALSTSGRANLRRIGMASETVDSLEIQLGPGFWGRHRIEGGDLLAMRRGEGIDWSMALDWTGGGSARGGGSFSGLSDRDAMAYSVHLALDSVPEPGSSSLLTGTLRGEGAGVRPSASRGTARIDLARSELGGWSVDTVFGSAEWGAGEGRVRGGLQGKDGDLRLDARVEFTENAGSVRGAVLVLDSLTLPDAKARNLFPSPISGRIEASVAWEGPPSLKLDRRGLSGEARFELAGTDIGGVPISRSTGEWIVRSGRMEGSLRAFLPDSGSVELQGTGSLLVPASIEISKGRFQGLALETLLPEAPHGLLNGQLTGRYSRGNSGEEPTGDLLVLIEPSSLAGDTLHSGRLHLTLEPDSASGHLSLELGAGELHGSISGAADRSRWGGELEASLPRAHRLLQGAGEGASLFAVLRGSKEAAEKDVSLALAVRSATGWGVVVDTAAIRGSLGTGALVLDTVLLRSTLIRADGRGALPARLLARGSTGSEPLQSSTAFTLQGAVQDSASFALAGNEHPWEFEGGSFRLDTQCEGHGCTVAGRAMLAPVHRGSSHVDSVDLTVDGVLDSERHWSSLSADLGIGDLRVASARLRSLAASVRSRGNAYVLDVSSVIRPQEEGHLLATVTPEDGRVRATVEALRIATGEGAWALSRPGVVDIVPGGITVETMEIASGNRRIEAGGIWTTETKDLSIVLDSLSIGGLAAVLGAEDIDGWLTGRLQASGENAESVTFRGNARGGLTYMDRPLHTVDAQATCDGKSCTLRTSFSDPSGQERLQLHGEIQGGVSGDGEMDLEVMAADLPLWWISAYLPQSIVQDVEGQVAAHLTFRGRRQDPDLQGNLNLSSGRMTLPSAGVTLTDLTLAVSGQGPGLAIDRLSAGSSGRGRARVMGEVGVPSIFEPPVLDLELEAEAFEAMDTPRLRAVITGDGSLTGTSRRPKLTGTANVVEGEVRLDDGLRRDLEEVTLSPEDWQVLGERFGLHPPQERGPSRFLPEDLDLDVTLSLARDIWLRQNLNPRMAVQFTGDATLRKEFGGALDLQGRLEAIPDRSFMEQFSRRFDLEGGTVQFAGPVEQTQLRIVFVFSPPLQNGVSDEVTIRMTFSGRPGDFELTLSSDPPMDNSDMISYLATGRPANQLLTGNEGGAAALQMGVGVLAQEVEGAVGRFARDRVGLDVIEIRQTGLEGASLVAGKYLTPQFFVGFRQPVTFQGVNEGSDRTDAEIEWRALRWLLANLRAGGSGFRFIMEAAHGY